MIKKVYSAVIILSLATPALAFAADDTEIHGVIELGVRGVDMDDNLNSAKFEEFRDRDDGVIGQVELTTRKGAYHFSLDAENPGTDDQSFELKGGEYGSFKYNFIYDEMPHNYSYDAKSFYSGLGTNNLVEAGNPADVSTWTTFDYKTEHKKYGGSVEVSLNSPFYISVGAQRREVEGTRPYSVRENVEVPEPIDYTTDDLNLKVGYADKTFSASVSGYMSSFDNNNNFLHWGDPSVGDTDTELDVLAPDNDYTKVAADLSWRDLPFRSVLALGASYSNLDNSYTTGDVSVTDYSLGTAVTNLNRTTFEGDIDYTTLSFALSSRPTAKMDTRIYYRYLDRDNDSTVISYGATTNAEELLSYEKDTAGIDIGYRLPNKTKLGLGYEYMNLDRSTAITDPDPDNRYDSPTSTTDDTFYVQLKNSSLDWVTAKLRYKRLERDSDHTPTHDPTQNAERYDLADKSMDEWKVNFDFYPMDRLDLGLEFAYRDSDFDPVLSGRTDDKRQQVYADFVWRAHKKLSLSGFIGFETSESDALHVGGDDHISSIDDDFWTYGLAATVPASDKLTINLSWQYQKSDGSVDFASLEAPAVTYVNITESDDYTKQQLEAKASYAIDPKWKMTVGYLYEKLEYSDINYANYQYIVGTDYYSGAYANQDYEANVGYLTVSYGF